jgi:Trp operon repressor
MESNTTSIRTLQNSYLNFINTQVKRNHDRLLKLLLTPGDDYKESITEECRIFEDIILANLEKDLH